MKENVVGCYEGNKTRWVLGMEEKDGNKKKEDYYCMGESMTTLVESMEGGIRMALERGFLMFSNSTTNDCEACKRSGGKCGFYRNQGYGFRCLCPDGDYIQSCPNTEGLYITLIHNLSFYSGFKLHNMMTINLFLYWLNCVITCDKFAPHFRDILGRFKMSW